MSDTKIDQARAAVESVQAEIDDLRRQLQELQRELAGLSGEGSQLDPSAVARRAAVVEAVSNLRLRLPKQSWRRGESLPVLQQKLQRAEAELGRTRAERFQIALTIAEIESMSDAWGDGVPAQVEAALSLVTGVCRRLGEYPPGYNERSLGGLVHWARSVRSRIESLPQLRERLESYGPDPEYQPSNWAELERGWEGTRMKLTYMRERLGRLGVTL